jgi:Uma2 family endonuclease
MPPGLKHKLDYDDLAHTPDDGKRYELLDGELYVTPAPSPQHQRISKRLQRQLEAYFEARDLGEVFAAPVDVILAPHDVVEPDLVVVLDDAQVSARAIEGAPALAVEILSPTTRDRDRTVKARRYAALGIEHYWIVDVRSKRVECYRRRGDRYESVLVAESNATFEHPDWPGLVIELAPLWIPGRHRR